MGNWTSIPVKKGTRDRLEDHDEKDGRDWDTFIRRVVFGESVDGDPDPVAQEEIVEGLFDDLRDQLGMLADPGVVADDEDIQRMLAQLDTIEERTGRLEQYLEGLQR